jgi:sigma-E factor negative regulatory protein RseA
MDTRLHENISALADGELASADIELAFATLATPGGQAAWTAYYQIGAALRSQHCGAELSADFSSRLALRLAADLAPGKSSDAGQSLPAGADGVPAAPDAATSLF